MTGIPPNLNRFLQPTGGNAAIPPNLERFLKPGDAAADPNQGFFNYVSDLASNWFKVNAVEERMGTTPDKDPQFTDPEMISIRNAVRKSQAMGGGTALALHDFSHMFGQMFKNVGSNLEQALKSPESFSVSGLAKSFVKPIGDVMELQSGVHLTNDDVTALTPEEKAERIKSAAGTAVLVATGMGVAKALEGAEAVGGLSRLVPKGKLARTALKGMAEGVTSGTAYGLVSHANESDQLAEALTDGVVFGTLGSAVHVLGSKMLTKAADVAKVRLLQDVEHKTIPQAIKQVEALASANDLADAVLDGKIGGPYPFVIPGVDPSRLGVLSEKVPENVRTVVHHHADGSADLLVHDGSVDESFFQKHGLIQDEWVTHEGKKYIVDNVIGAKVRLLTARGRSILVDRSSIRRLSNVEPGVSQANYYHYGEYAGGKSKPERSITGEEAYHGSGLYFAPEKDASKVPSLQLAAYVDHTATERWRAFQIDPKTKLFDLNAPVDKKLTDMMALGMEEPVRSEFRDAVASGKIKTNSDLRDWHPQDSDYEDELRMGSGEDFNAWLREAGYEGVKGDGEINIFPGFEKRIKRGALVQASTLTREGVTEGLYKTWRADLNKPAEAAPRPDRTEPIGFDETPPADFLEQIPQRSITAHLDDFLQQRGFSLDEQKSIKQAFMERLANEAIDKLSPNEKKLIANAQTAAEEHHANSPIVNVRTEALVRLARSNNMTIDDGGSGRIIVRDRKTHQILGGFDNNDEAAKWINRTGQANGVDLDQNNAGIATGAAAGGTGLPPIGPPSSKAGFPYGFFGRFGHGIRGLASERFIRGLDNIALLTRTRDWVLKIDTDHQTQFHQGVLEETQRLKNSRDQRMIKWLERTKPIEALLMKMSGAEREDVGRWLETMNPQQVISRFLSRPMNPLEVSLARQLVDKNIDLGRVFKYTRELERMKEVYEGKNDPQSLTQYDLEKHQAKSAFGIDDTHEWAANLFETIKGLGKQEASLGAITRLARSLADNEPTRNEFEAKNKLSYTQIQAGRMLEKLYGELAKEFDIPEISRLGGYMTHAKLYYEGNVSRALRNDFSGDTRARGFYAKMARTGEIDSYETDPLRAIQRYIKSGFDVASGFQEAVARARNFAKNEVERLPAGMRRHVLDVMENYLDDIRGFPGAGDTFAQEAIDKLGDILGFLKDPDLRRQWVNGLIAVTHAATIGARPVMGFFHLMTGAMVSVAGRDLEYTERVFKQGAYARSHPEIMDEIRKAGALSTISPISNFSSTEYALEEARSARFTRALEKGSEVLFKLTGLPNVFEMLSAGHYLATKADALNALTRLGRKDITWGEVAKKTFLNRYDDPIIRRFTELAKAGKTEEAASYLGTQAVDDLIGRFGNANHPYKWGTNWGRLLGQFGNWPIWLRSTVTRLASRGTVGERLGAIAKLSAMSWAGVQVGNALGIDLSRMNYVEGFSWWGGPLEGIAEDLRDWMHGTGYTSEAGKRRLIRLLPWHTDADGNTSLTPSIFVPASFAIDNIVHGLNDISEGNIVQGAWEMAGGRKTRDLSAMRSQYGLQ